MFSRLLYTYVVATLPLLAADQMVGGPFVVNVTPRSATVVWIVQSGEATLGTSPQTADRTAPALRVEKIVFSNLKPGTTYHYDVNGLDSGKGTFKTPPAGSEPFEFVVYGDTRTRHDVHRRVVDAIVKNSSPEFVVHTGDLVSDGTESAQWPVFFDIENKLLRQTAFFPSLGNHERNSRQFYEFFQIGATPYYSFDWGKAHIIVLNSDIGNAASGAAAKKAFWAEQQRWLEEDLQRSQGADFRFVMAHHPPFTAVSNRQGSNPEMAALVPLFEKYKLTAGFFGHDHNYQHYLKSGVHYVITGGGGAPLYNVDTPPAGITQKVSSVEHFVKIHVSGASAKATALTLDGKTLDEFDMTAAPSK
jgi:hypothetical protein